MFNVIFIIIFYKTISINANINGYKYILMCKYFMLCVVQKYVVIFVWDDNDD